VSLPHPLPPPLDPAHEAVLWTAAAAGDAAARATLIAHHLRLVAREAWRVDPTGRHHEALCDAGVEALCHAARAFDPARGLRFSTLAVLAIRRRMLNARRDAARAPVVLPWADEPPASADPLPDPADTVAAQDLAARLRAALAQLSPADRALLAVRFGLDGADPASRAAVARRLGVTPPAVARRERRALARLRAALDSAGLSSATI
jgi:RNA polymerase sigma factor (sigma-70 family)